MTKWSTIVADNKWIGVISGWGIWYSSSVWYDRYAYPALMLYFGIIWGGVIAASVAMLICAAFLLFYELTDSKWIKSTDEIFSNLVIKSEKITRQIKKIEEYGIFLKIIFVLPYWILLGISHFLGLSKKCISRRGIPGFIVLSCISDPFITVSYFRDSNKRTTLESKDWGLFFLSGVIANSYWILYSSIIVIAIELVWNFSKSFQM